MIQNDIRFDEAQHRYFNISTGDELISCSKFLSLFEPQFDRNFWSQKVAKRDGVSQASVLKDWDSKTKVSQDHGTRIHKVLEDFGSTFKVEQEHEDLEPMVKSVYADYKGYARMEDEVRLYTKYGVAGTTDKIMYVTSHKASLVDVEDFKTNLRKGIEYHNPKSRAFFNYPVDHLIHCNYIKYSLQLSFYAFCVEELTGRKIRNLWIRYIPADDFMQHVRIAVPYMKLEIEAMLREFKRMRESGEFVFGKGIIAKPGVKAKMNVSVAQEEPNFGI